MVKVIIPTKDKGSVACCPKIYFNERNKYLLHFLGYWSFM